MRKPIFNTAISLLMIATIYSGTQNAHAQLTQNWDVAAHQKAEQNHSAAVSLLLKRQLPLAITALEKATAADPTHAQPFATLGLVLAMQGKYDEALRALEKSYQLNHSTETLLSTGIVYFLQHDYDAAITSWNKVIERDRKACNVYGNLGFAYMHKGEFSNAEESFQKLFKCNPSSEFGYYGLAYVQYLRGNLAAARSAAEHAQSIRPYAPSVLLLAKLDALRGDRASALKRAQQYNSLVKNKKMPERSMTQIGYPLQHDFKWDPYRVDNWDNGYLLSARLQDALTEKKRISLASQGKAGAVIEAATNALKENPNDLFLLRELALAQAANADYQHSAETFQQLLEHYPYCQVDMLHEARVLWLMGRGEEGAAFVQEFHRKLPKETISPAFELIGKEPPPVPKSQQPKPEKAPKEKAAPKEKVVKEKPVKVKPEKPKSHLPIQDDKGVPASQF